jgi:SnoaL-like domain
MSDLEDIVTRLETRVKLLEDQLALYRIVSTYGPAMDTGSAEAAGSLWAEDGVYEFDTTRAKGPAGIAAMAESDGMRAQFEQGSAHVLSMPILRVTGDTARATGYSRVYLHTPEGYDVWRVAANHWEFIRTTEGWRVSRRTNRVIDGSPEAREILRRGLGNDGS